MLAFAEMLKNLTPVKRMFSKESSFRKRFFERITDLLAIILSIYLALNIEGWAEKRIEHKRLIQYYQNLASEIEKDTVSLSQVIADAEKHIQTTGTHINLLRDYKPTLLDTITSLYRGMLSSEVFYSSQMISYQAMVLSGDLRLIEDLEVREELIELEEVYKSLKIYEELYLNFILNRLTTAFSESFDLLSMQLVNEKYYSQHNYRNLVAEFYAHNANRLNQYNEAMKKARETREVILNELHEKK